MFDYIGIYVVAHVNLRYSNGVAYVKKKKKNELNSDLVIVRVTTFGHDVYYLYDNPFFYVDEEFEKKIVGYADWPILPT